MAKNEKYTITLDSKPAKRMRTLLTVLLVISILAFLFNAGNAYAADRTRKQTNEAQRVAKKVELVVTNKTNANANGYRVEFDFAVDITNNSAKAVNYVEGIFTIMDKSGNVLSTGTASFGTDMMNTTERAYNFPSKSTQHYTLEWRSDQTDDSVKIWESDFSDLQFSFEITRLRVENNITADIK